MIQAIETDYSYLKCFYSEPKQYLMQFAEVNVMPLLMAKKEVFAWLKAGVKTVDVRKGNGRRGDIAVFSAVHIIFVFAS